MPDVTPKTESGRAYQCPGCWSVTMNVPTDDGYECDCGERLTRIDLRDSEAASAAVAEVLDAAEAVIEWLGPCDHFDHHGNCQTHGVEKPCRVETLRALIASESGT